MTTSTGARRGAVAFFAMMAVALMGASMAWACSATPQVWFSGSGSSASGAPGQEVTIEGSEWEEGEVSIRWDSVTAEPFARAKGPSFSVKVIVPNVRPDVYTIYFTQASANGGVARASFEVTPAPRQTSDPSAGGEPAQETKTSASGSGAEGSQSGSGQRSATTSGGNSEASGGTSGGQSQSGASGDSDRVQSFPTAEPATTGNTAAAGAAPAAGVRPGAVATPSGQVVFGGSVAVPGSSAPVGTADDEAAQTASTRAASGDLWSGFAAGTGASLMPSLLDPAASGDSTPVGPLVLMAALAGPALVALFGGFALAELRRKRALAISAS